MKSASRRALREVEARLEGEPGGPIGSTGPAPEPSTAPGRSRAATRERLVRAGTELFASRGLDRTTTVQIARRAGVAAGTFYLHFADKHALFREIALAAFAGLRERLSRAAAAAGDDPIAIVRARAEEICDFAEENRSLVLILFGRDGENAQLVEDIFADTVPGTEAGLRRRVETGQLRAIDPSVTAQALTAMWQRVVTWWMEDPSRTTRRAVVDTLVQLHPFAHLES